VYVCSPPPTVFDQDGYLLLEHVMLPVAVVCV